MRNRVGKNDEITSTFFLKTEEIQIHPMKFSEIQEELVYSYSYVSESIISLILKTVAKQYNIPVWSHITFNVSKEDGLVGEPDFLIAPKLDYDFAPSYPIFL